MHYTSNIETCGLLFPNTHYIWRSIFHGVVLIIARAFQTLGLMGWNEREVMLQLLDCYYTSNLEECNAKFNEHHIK